DVELSDIGKEEDRPVVLFGKPLRVADSPRPADRVEASFPGGRLNLPDAPVQRGEIGARRCFVGWPAGEGQEAESQDAEECEPEVNRKHDAPLRWEDGLYTG